MALDKNLSVEIQNYMLRNIPLVNAMGFCVDSVDLDRGVCLRAPLAANINDKQIAFGGSINTLAILSCWAWVFAQVDSRSAQADIVIAESQCKFLLPIGTDFKAKSSLSTETVSWDELFESYFKKGKARITITSQVLDSAGRVAAQFQGRFVLLKPKAKEA